MTSGDRPVREQVPVGDIRHPVTSFGFVHIVGRDQKREPFGGKLMDLFPEFATSLRVHAGRRLVEQQKLRLVNQTGREREPLLPAARQLSGQLLPTFSKPKSLETPLDGFPPVLHGEHAGHEVQIFSDTEVFVKAEPLGHVADLSFDGFTFPNDVVPQTGAATFIRTKQTAEHPDECGLPAAVRAEKSVDLSATDLEADPIDDRALAEPFCHAANVDGERLSRQGVHRADPNNTSTGCPGFSSAAADGSKTSSTIKTSFSRLS